MRDFALSIVTIMLGLLFCSFDLCSSLELSPLIKDIAKKHSTIYSL